MASYLSPYARYGQPNLTGINQFERQHTVIAGETLMSIAAYEYKTGYDSELWRQIAEANSIDDVPALGVNTVLAIPSPKASLT